MEEVGRKGYKVFWGLFNFTLIMEFSLSSIFLNSTQPEMLPENSGNVCLLKHILRRNFTLKMHFIVKTILYILGLTSVSLTIH